MGLAVEYYADQARLKAVAQAREMCKLLEKRIEALELAVHRHEEAITKKGL